MSILVMHMLEDHVSDGRMLLCRRGRAECAHASYLLVVKLVYLTVEYSYGERAHMAVSRSVFESVVWSIPDSVDAFTHVWWDQCN